MNSSLRPGPTPHSPTALSSLVFFKPPLSEGCPHQPLPTEMPSGREQEEKILYKSLYHFWDFRSHRTSTPDKNEPSSLISGWEARMSGALRGKLQGVLEGEGAARE